MAAALGVGLQLGGSLISGLAAASAARKKNALLAQGSREQSRAGMESAGVMSDFLTQLRGSAPNPAAERGAFTSALGAQGVSALPTSSARFSADAAGVTSGAQGYGRNMADLFARIRAPGLQRQQESELLMNMSNAQRPIQMRSQDQEFLTNLRAGMVQPSPWAGLLGQGLQGLGSYYTSKLNPRSLLGGNGVAAGIGGNYSDLLTNGRAV